MSQTIKSVIIVAVVLLLWASSSALFGRAFGVVQPCMFLGIIFCLLLLLPISRNENMWKRLTFQSYDEKKQAEKGGEPQDLLLALVIGIPFSIFCIGLIYWLGSLLLL